MKLALALIVKGNKKEAKYLQNCLKYVKDYVDGIFITTTYKENKSECKEVNKVAKKHKANVSYYKWKYDFSDARNFNFKQVPKEYDYIMWLDADDIVRGAEKIKKTIKENPDVDIFGINYYYSFDEWNNPVVVHQKEQIMKNDGCVVWEGSLHEGIKATREVKTKLIKDIERIHTADDIRFQDNKERNLEVSQKQLKKLPKDPRSYWNVANSLKALGRNKEAIKKFEEFLEKSKSDNEKYIARMRLAECYWGLAERHKAIEVGQYALGLKPEYPDAYNLLGALYLETKQFEKARDSFLLGLSKKPPYYDIIVYNPRDYDYNPLMNLAKTYFQMNMPTLALEALKACKKIYPKDNSLNSLIDKMEEKAKEFDAVTEEIKKIKKIKNKKELKKKLDKLPDEMKAHPAICSIRNTHFIKEKSSGKDISFVCGYTQEEWTPQTAKEKGIGGSEEAVIHLTNRWVEDGYNVTVYNNCGYKEQRFGKVLYKPFWTWNYRDKQDVVILWRHPKMAEYDINADKIFVDLHDVIQEGEFTEKRLKNIDKIFVKSNFHRSLFPNIPDNKFVVVPNGIDPDKFNKEYEKDPYLLVNTSSPDRSLRALIDCFAEIKKQIPEARCKWAYGWGVWDNAYASDPEKVAWKEQIIKDMNDVGIENLGRVSHDEVAKLYQKANIFAYPSEFAEIDCISLTKAMAAGATPIITDFSALGEKKGHGGVFLKSKKNKDNWCQPYQFDFSMDKSLYKDFINAVVKQLKNPERKKEMRTWALENYNWNKVASVWIKNFK